MADNKKVILDFQIDVGESLDVITKINKELLQLQKEKKELDKALKDGTATEEMVAHYSEVTAAIKTLSKARAAEQKEIYQEMQQYRFAADTVQGMSDRLRQMKDEYVKMSAEMRNSPMGKQLAQDIRETTTAIAVMKDEMQPSFIEKFNQKIISVTASFNRFPKTLSGLKAGLATITSAFKVLFRTIIMNPIGLLITAITGLVVIIGKFFKETAAGQRIMKVFGDATKGLVDILTGFVNIVATAVEWVLKLIPAYRQAAEAAEEAARSQKLYNELQEQSNATLEKNAKARAKHANDIEQLNAIINDSENKSNEEREKAIKKKHDLLMKDLDDDAIWATQRSRFLETKKELTEEEKADLEKATNILNNYQHEKWKIDQTIDADNDKLQKEEKANQDKRIKQYEDFINKREEITNLIKDLEIDLMAKTKDSLEKLEKQEIAQENESYKRTKKSYEEKYKGQKQLYELLEKLKKVHEEKLQEIEDKYKEDNLKGQVEDLSKTISLAQVKASTEELKALIKDESLLQAYEDNEVKKSKIFEQQAQRRLQTAQNELKTLESYTDEQKKLLYGDDWQIVYENKIQEATLAVVKAQGDVQNAVNNTNKIILDQQAQLREQMLNTVAAVDGAVGGINELYNTIVGDQAEATGFSKALAMTQILISTAVSIVQAIEGATKAGAQFGVLAPAMIPAFIAELVGIVSSSIASAVAVLKKAKTPSTPKFAEGGMVGSKETTRTDDTVPAMLSEGEYVIRSSVVKKLGTGFFDQLNGGKGDGSFRFATGGSVPSMSTLMATMDWDSLRNVVLDAVASAPNPVVSVKEINTMNNKVLVKENIASY